MDDTQVKSGQTAQPIQNNQQQSVAQPVGSGAKEMPIISTTPPKEWVSPSTPEIAPPPEVQQYVEVTPEVPAISQAAQQAGVQHAKEAVPVEPVKPAPLSIDTPHPTIQVLMKVHKNVKDGITWLLGIINKEQERESIGKGGAN